MIAQSTRSNGNQQQSSTDLLELLGDDYARRVLQVLSEDPLAVKQIAERTGFSRPTVYRRLDRLEQAGLVRSELVPSADGNHHRRYWSVFEGATFQIDDGAFSVRVRTDSKRPTRQRRAQSDDYLCR